MRGFMLAALAAIALMSVFPLTLEAKITVTRPAQVEPAKPKIKIVRVEHIADARKMVTKPVVKQYLTPAIYKQPSLQCASGNCPNGQCQTCPSGQCQAPAGCPSGCPNGQCQGPPANTSKQSTQYSGGAGVFRGRPVRSALGRVFSWRPFGRLRARSSCGC